MIQTNHIKIFTVVLTSISYLIGEHWNLLLILLILNILDAITGTLKAKRTNKESSITGFKGIIKKIAQWFLLLLSFLMSSCFKEIGYILEINLSISTFLGWYVYTYFIINECRSILENLYQLGVSIPQVLIKGLEIANKVIDNNENSNPTNK